MRSDFFLITIPKAGICLPHYKFYILVVMSGDQKFFFLCEKCSKKLTSGNELSGSGICVLLLLGFPV